jgi:tripartite-type tricarboxylate transporter receptor subunit TctC
MKRRNPWVALVLSLLIIYFGAAREAGAQSDTFYKGKTIRIYVGSTAGGFYDRWARLFARYMGKYIPGNPEIIAQNMPGAGSVIATNHVFNVGKPDGLSLVMPLNSVYVDQLAGRKEVQFDLRKFHWIGSPAVESVIFYMRADTPYKSIADIIKAKEPPKCGGTGTASSDYILSKILEEFVGAKFNSVLGYAGGTEIDIAWKKARWYAARTARRRISAASLSIPGTKRALTAIWCRLHASAIPAPPTYQPLTRSSINTKFQRTTAASPILSWRRAISAVR